MSFRGSDDAVGRTCSEELKGGRHSTQSSRELPFCAVRNLAFPVAHSASTRVAASSVPPRLLAVQVPLPNGCRSQIAVPLAGSVPVCLAGGCTHQQMRSSLAGSELPLFSALPGTLLAQPIGATLRVAFRSFPRRLQVSAGQVRRWGAHPPSSPPHVSHIDCDGAVRSLHIPGAGHTLPLKALGGKAHTSRWKHAGQRAVQRWGRPGPSCLSLRLDFRQARNTSPEMFMQNHDQH